MEDCLKITKVDNTFLFPIIVARSSRDGFAPQYRVLASSRSGVKAWGWRDPRMKEQFQLTLDSQEMEDEGWPEDYNKGWFSTELLELC